MRRPTSDERADAATDTPARSQVRTARLRITKRPSGGSILVLIGIIVGVLILAPTTQRVIAQRQEIAQIERDIAQAKQDIKQIETDNARWDDPAFVRAEARGRLLFVQPGDTTYLVIDAEKHHKTDVPVDLSTEVRETKADPVALYVDSLIGAEQANAPNPVDGKPEQPQTDPAPAPTP